MSLYDTMCKGCKYKMYTRPGCIKFGLTKRDIDNEYTVHYLDKSSHRLTEDKQCRAKELIKWQN